jgi:transposase-like protein
MLDLLVPQTRAVAGGEPFYSTFLERGLRSERVLKLAIAEMYVQGVSTRRVESITRQLCGLDLTSTEVSRAAAELDEMLQSWRTRSLDELPYLIVNARAARRCATVAAWCRAQCWRPWVWTPPASGRRSG